MTATQKDASAFAAATHRFLPIESAPRDGSTVLVAYVIDGALFAHAAWYQSEEQWAEFGQSTAAEGETKDGFVGWWTNDRYMAGQQLLDGAHAPSHWFPLPAGSPDE